MMGNKVIKVDEYNNIHLDNTVIKGTVGLWRLIMMKSPEVYEPEDSENYKELIERTNVLEYPHKTSSSDRPKNTSKWRFFTENEEEL